MDLECADFEEPQNEYYAANEQKKNKKLNKKK